MHKMNQGRKSSTKISFINQPKLSEHEVDQKFIDAPILEFAYTNEKMNEIRIYFKMGQTLRLMHRPKAEGFGKLVDGTAEFEKFDEWVKSPDMLKRIDYITENQIIDGAEILMKKVTDILIEEQNGTRESSYCHYDFGIHNIFATDPITVFDPSPRFNNFYIDIGRSAQSFIAHDHLESLEQFIEGYFDGESYNQAALQASIIFNMLYKMPYLHKTKRYDNIENYKKYINSKKI